MPGKTPTAVDDTHPFNVRDLVMLQRVGDPQLSPDGRQLVFVVRRTDYRRNKGISAVYKLDLTVRDAEPVRLIDAASSPRIARDGKTVYVLADAAGIAQLWALPLAGGKAVQVTHYAVAVSNFALAPDGAHVALSLDVFTDCDDLAGTAARLKARKANKASGRIHDQLFVRHWDSWADGRHAQLFVARLADPAAPAWVSRGIEGDIPSRPFGDASEYAFSPDSKMLYFNARLATPDEPRSTNFDIYAAPADGSASPRNLTAFNKAWDGWAVPSPDGRSLYYLAHTVPGYESDRFRVMALDLASGETREVTKRWDRSASHLGVSADGKTLYAVAEDHMQRPLFAIDVASGKVRKLVDTGSVSGYAIGKRRVVIAKADLSQPAALYACTPSGRLTRLTHFNERTLAATARGEVEYFRFKGAGGDTVYGYVVKPANFDPCKKYPVAFLIHGGPQGAFGNGWSYRWNPQTYAGQGCAVVAVNFHGSVGFGQAFTDAIARDWGGQPLKDLQLGWEYVTQRYRWLDASRAAALGASYGGYMVYWMAGVWNGPWKCFVDHDGVFDSRMMYYATEELWFEEHEHGGPQYRVPARYEKFNPINHVKDWRVPTLVIHSERDFRIPIAQGLAAFTALQRRGIPSRLLTFPDENHWVSKPHNSVLWHDTVNAWLARWLKPD